MMYTDLLFLEMVYWFFCMNFAAYKVLEYKHMWKHYGSIYWIELVGVFALCTIVAPVGAVIDLFRK